MKKYLHWLHGWSINQFLLSLIVSAVCITSCSKSGNPAPAPTPRKARIHPDVIPING